MAANEHIFTTFKEGFLRSFPFCFIIIKLVLMVAVVYEKDCCLTAPCEKLTTNGKSKILTIMDNADNKISSSNSPFLWNVIPHAILQIKQSNLFHAVFSSQWFLCICSFWLFLHCTLFFVCLFVLSIGSVCSYVCMLYVYMYVRMYVGEHGCRFILLCYPVI